MTQQLQQVLQKQLWNIVSDLRGGMYGEFFRDYILSFIFYKYLSDKLSRFADELISHDGIKFTQIDENTDEGREKLKSIEEEAQEELGYFFKPSGLFHVLAQAGAHGEIILDDISKVFLDIENSTIGTDSADDFKGIFDELDLNSSRLGPTIAARNKLITRAFGHLEHIDFHLENSDVDILGDAYEYLIGMFASSEGKKSGEYYTPQMVSELLAKLVTFNNPSLKSVYDPTCGSGSLLLRVAREAKNTDLEFYGQELNTSTYNLARMNMFMHNVHYSHFDIQNDDTLEHPAHIDRRFGAVVANPPFSARWSAGTHFLNDSRFAAYGKLPPKSKADLAFVLHMIHHLDDDGTMAVVVPHGILFRGAGEEYIRKCLIEEKNCVDMVIGLPGNILFGTGVPICILVLKKNRKPDDSVFFIDASQCFEKVRSHNVIREADITRIIDAAVSRVNIDSFSLNVSRKELAENDYNLNIPRYVDASPEVKYLNALQEQLEDYDPELLHKSIIQYVSYIPIQLEDAGLSTWKLSLIR